ncbi:unnamed protein product [Oncorhynchus mykiss]|uniref:Uncharacterized protein n=1 Tax=Oncorhynchus mykiss TaxID=8022 RepID=A0A060YDJ6_ONCMY|nr:unnamed protein product [Oncorhynchus mykiss]
MSFTTAFGKNLQRPTIEVYFAASSLTAVLHLLNEVLDNIEGYHDFYLLEKAPPRSWNRNPARELLQRAPDCPSGEPGHQRTEQPLF